MSRKATPAHPLDVVTPENRQDRASQTQVEVPSNFARMSPLFRTSNGGGGAIHFAHLFNYFRCLRGHSRGVNCAEGFRLRVITTNTVSCVTETGAVSFDVLGAYQDDSQITDEADGLSSHKKTFRDFFSRNKGPDLRLLATSFALKFGAAKFSAKTLRALTFARDPLARRTASSL